MLNAKEYLSLAILIFGASMTSADVLDFTIVVNSAVVDANDEVNFGGYLHKSEESTSIFLGQNILTETDSNENEVEWTDGDNPPIVLDNSFFPTGTSLGTETTSEYQALIMTMPNSSGIAKVGSFYGKAMAQNKEEFIPFVILNSNATVVPKYRSLTASIGDDLTGLIMVTSYGTGSYRWRHNGRNVITSYNGKSSLELTNVRMADAGVYECYLHETGRDGRHAIIQINVKGCSKRKWGTDCDLNCPVCYNGGICDHITGLCICAAGFEGVDCSKGCESSNWGRECSINSLTEHIGKTFCPPHPLSCSCYAGYTGHVCDQECILGMYGPDCACVCHCPTNVCDRHKGCAEDSVCHLGYAGKTCLEHLSCPPGMFGEFCQYTCHCESKKTDIIAGCDKHTGECLNDVSCSSGWGGSDCQIALPILKRNPTTSVTENSITISWEPWRSSIDYGTGPVIKYQVIYRTPPNSGFPFIVWREVNVDDLMRVDIDDLEPRTNYEIRIILHRQIDGENYTSIGSSKIVVTSGEDKIMDFTFYCATPRVDVDDNTMSTFIGGYSGSDHQTSDIQIGKIVTEIGEDFLGREITWNDGSKVGVILGNETMFPAGTRVHLATPENSNALRVFIDSASGVNKLGAFYAKANKLRMCSCISSEIVSIILSKQASVTSVKRTWTTGTGERVMMDMVADNSTDKWWRHNGITLNQWNNSLSIKIDVVRKQDAGIYECLPSENSENGNKGITNLIVRECPLRKWGPPHCLRNCPTCYNGGVCDDVTGSCVCTVGFRGVNCEIACGSDTFGRHCSIFCSSKDIESCMGKVICPPSPQGCSCTDGYTGPDCLDECSSGMYGSDCQQRCQCDVSHCDRKFGCNGICYEGYTGPQCQELVHDRTCSNGHFGALCNYPCHCQHSSNCHRNGSCDNGCTSEWTGADCSIALPYILRRLNVTDIRATSIDVSHLWVFGEDFGTGPATAYVLCYRSTTDWLCQKTIQSLSTINDLIPNTTIEVKVQVFKRIGYTDIGGPMITVTRIRTICLKPLDSPKVETLSTIKNTIVVKWKAVDFNPTRLQCDSLLHYDVGYQTRINDAWETFQVNYDQTEATINFLAYDMVYQVRVRAVNTAGITGPWSEIWTIKIPENKTGSKIAIYVLSSVVALLVISTVVVLDKLRRIKRQVNGCKKDSGNFQINTISKPSQNYQDDSYTSLQKEACCLAESPNNTYEQETPKDEIFYLNVTNLSQNKQTEDAIADTDTTYDEIFVGGLEKERGTDARKKPPVPKKPTLTNDKE